MAQPDASCQQQKRNVTLGCFYDLQQVLPVGTTPIPNRSELTDSALVRVSACYASFEITNSQRLERKENERRIGSKHQARVRSERCPTSSSKQREKQF
jgi:hypothetical protein